MTRIMRRTSPIPPKHRIGVIGLGPRGRAIAKGVVRGNKAGVQKKQLTVYDANENSASDFSRVNGVAYQGSLAGLVENSDTVIYAADSHESKEIGSQIHGNFAGGKRHLIFAAPGRTVEKIERDFGPVPRLTRVATNLNIAIGEGITGIYQKNKNPFSLDITKYLFGALGRTVQVEKEQQMNPLTLLGEKGPGLLCFFLEAMEKVWGKGIEQREPYIARRQAFLNHLHTTATFLLEGNEEMFKTFESSVFGDNRILDRAIVERVYANSGRPAEVELDPNVIYGGGGASWYFSLLHPMIEAGIKSKLPADIARTVVFQTAIGTSRYLLKNEDLEPTELKQRVTSPGGTTERVIDVWRARQLDQRISKAFAEAISVSQSTSQAIKRLSDYNVPHIIKTGLLAGILRARELSA